MQLDGLEHYIGVVSWLVILSFLISTGVYLYKRNTLVTSYTSLNKDVIQDSGVSLSIVSFLVLSIVYYFLNKTGMEYITLFVMGGFMIMFLILSGKIATGLNYSDWLIALLNFSFPILFVGIVMTFLMPLVENKVLWTIMFFFFFNLGHAIFFFWLSNQKSSLGSKIFLNQIPEVNEKYSVRELEIRETFSSKDLDNKQIIKDEISSLKDQYVDEISNLLYTLRTKRLEKQRGIAKEESIKVQMSHLRDLYENKFNLIMPSLKII